MLGWISAMIYLPQNLGLAILAHCEVELRLATLTPVDSLNG